MFYNKIMTGSVTRFNSIELHQEDYDEIYIYNQNIDQSRLYDLDDSEEEAIIVVQHLAPEQYQYEFPSKTCLRALAYLDNEEEEYSFFDESSFTSSSTAYSSASYFEDSTTMVNHMSSSWHETIMEQEGEEDDQLVEDGRLSPLQLPAQADAKTNLDRRPRESSCDSVQTITRSACPVGPFSFLSDVHKSHLYSNVTQSKATSEYQTQDYPSLSFVDSEDEEDINVFCNESEPIIDSDFDSSTSTSSSFRTTESRIVLIKLNKHKKLPMSFVQRCPTSLTYVASDEGYDDTEDDGEELESHCVFYPLSDSEDSEDLESIQQDRAAIKIQAAWRGYCSRRQNKQQFACLRADQRVIMNLAQLCGKIHRCQMNIVDDRLQQLEQRVRKETAMRIAFEKAMEKMIVLIDQQQKILYDRLEQEVHMRQVYESKFNAALAQLQPLESRLRKEVSARNKMEEMMTRVLDQMHDSETSRQLQAKEDAESKRLAQSKLDRALEDIAIIKKQQQSSTVTRTPNSRPSPPTVNLVKKNNSSTTTTIISSMNKTLRNDSTSIRPSSTVRRSIVPTNRSETITNAATPNIRRQPRSINNKNVDTIASSSSNINSSSKRTVSNNSLLERPSVVPSNRRPISHQNSTKTNTTSRRTFLSRK